MKPQLLVYEPISEGAENGSSIFTNQQWIQTRLGDSGVNVSDQLISEAVDIQTVIQEITPKLGPYKDQKIKCVVSKFRFQSEDAKKQFLKAFPLKARSPAAAGASSSAAWHHWIDSQPKSSFKAFGIRRAYGRLSQEDLAAALQPLKAVLVTYCRLRAPGINLYTNDDMLMIIRARNVPKELKVGEATFKLFWIQPAPAASSSGSYAAAVASHTFDAIQARDEIAKAVEKSAAEKTTGNNEHPAENPGAGDQPDHHRDNGNEEMRGADGSGETGQGQTGQLPCTEPTSKPSESETEGTDEDIAVTENAAAAEDGAAAEEGDCGDTAGDGGPEIAAATGTGGEPQIDDGEDDVAMEDGEMSLKQAEALAVSTRRRGAKSHSNPLSPSKIIKKSTATSPVKQLKAMKGRPGSQPQRASARLADKLQTSAGGVSESH